MTKQKSIIFAENLLGKSFHRLFVTWFSETGGMLDRLRGMDAPGRHASLLHWWSEDRSWTEMNCGLWTLF